jgi:Xaa-Pro aminopeptidase
MGKEEEIKEKEGRVTRFLEEEDLDALLLERQDNFAWFTAGGDSHVVTASERGAASILITKEKKYIITTNIEAPRIISEEVKNQRFELKSFPWHESRKEEIVLSLTKGMKLGSDTFFPEASSVDISPLRYSLTPEEIERYGWLGGKSSLCLGKVCKEIKPGETENEVAAKLAKEVLSSGVTPTVLLIAADERISQYRHPIPRDKKIDKYVMVVLCARKWGLVVSVTRLVHFGKLPPQIRQKHNAVVKIDAALISRTRPGAKVGDIFEYGREAYAQAGYPEEWKFHHQGGPTGYAGRDYKATPDNENIIQLNQAVAWNPSIRGTKSEDTIIALKDKTEIITSASDWPMIGVEIEGMSWQRPDILIK